MTVQKLTAKANHRAREQRLGAYIPFKDWPSSSPRPPVADAVVAHAKVVKDEVIHDGYHSVQPNAGGGLEGFLIIQG